MTSPATYPNFPGKHAEEAIITPADFVAYLRRLGSLGDEQPPDGVILCYQRSLLDQILASEGLAAPRSHGVHGVTTLPSTGARVGVLGQFGIGAPAAATALEELAALGIKRFVSIGTAGSLQHHLRVGEVVLCDAAIRDEGVSHHYLPPARVATPCGRMTAAMGAALEAERVRFQVGTSWTIDAPYRETVAEARHYQAEGVLCVEMEAAALFAVAEVRRLQVASAFIVSDSLAELVWDPRFHGVEVREGLTRLYRAALRALETAADEGPIEV